MPTRLSTPTLADLAAAQQACHLFAFTLGDESRILNRMRLTHAKKEAQLNAYADLLAETTPDVVLRAADGREVVLRLPANEFGYLIGPLREVLERELRKLEEQIINELLQQAEGYDQGPDDLRPAILALCQPTPPVAAPLAGRPMMEVAGSQASSLPTAA